MSVGVCDKCGDVIECPECTKTASVSDSPELPGYVVERFLESGRKYLDEIANQPVCPDRSCIRCRIADILNEVERKYLETI